MPLKSVVDIDLNDEKFKRFTALYGKYEEALKKQPGQWRTSNEAAAGVEESVNKILAAFLATGQFHRELAEESEKDNKNLKHKATLWEGIRQSSASTLKNIEGASKWLLKWGLIGFGAAGAGLFGLRELGSDIANQRNQALGLDLAIGQEQAFGRHQGRYFSDPDALLRGAFTARANVASPAYQAAVSLGINPNQSTVAVADQILLRLQALAKALPKGQVGNLLLEYPGLSQFGIDLQGLERLRNLHTSELRGQIAAYGPDARATALSDRQGLAYQNFVTGIDRTFAIVGRQIERDLVPLLGPIERFVRGVGQDLGIFLRSKAAQQGIEDFAKAIQRFALYVSSSVFKQDVQDFVDGMGTVFNVLGTAGHIIAHPIATTEESAGDIWGGIKSWAAHRRGLATEDSLRAIVERGRGSINPILQPARPLAQVHVTLHLPPGGNILTTTNSLNGGVGP